ncbi:hypothetical protein TNIN_459071 [Trichonephila inaurata madagascariensis]|uniref:Uncharacterized protein n=1 Tax=Trichonephila inaurata madagascariensis TaxID=2747483 RepID=A0A8X6X7A2_9ARAC|nr:hypothetical protein TNIN_459071 [Trichonephila inaurata madagascariensis]
MTMQQAENQFNELANYLVVRAINICPVPYEVEDEISTVFCLEYESLENSINHFRYIFNQEFKELFHLELKGILECQYSRVKFLLSRCLAICDEPTLTSFVFACAFIFHMIFCWFTERNCYQIITDCRFCLCSLYKRKLCSIFRTPGDYEQLKLFCKDVHGILSPKLENEELSAALDCLPDRGQGLFGLMEKCITASEKAFSLNHLEVEFCERERIRTLNNLKRHFGNATQNIVLPGHSALDQSLDDFERDQVDTNNTNDTMESESEICEFCGFKCGL